jgi:hypothetical protein
MAYFADTRSLTVTARPMNIIGGTVVLACLAKRPATTALFGGDIL